MVISRQIVLKCTKEWNTAYPFYIYLKKKKKRSLYDPDTLYSTERKDKVYTSVEPTSTIVQYNYLSNSITGS